MTGQALRTGRLQDQDSLCVGLRQITDGGITIQEGNEAQPFKILPDIKQELLL